MLPSDWDRIQELYYEALPILPAERADFVARACSFDPLITREVTSLLEADESMGDFLDPPIFGVGLKIISSRDSSETAAPVKDMIGSTIDGRYLVEKELGRGGIGAVYLARDMKLHQKPVVVKILLSTSQRDPYVLKKFRQEVEALARIDHPAVVTVLGAGELADGKPYILMQFVDGVTLRSQIPREGMDLERAALILRQVGDALDNVHERGIFHRDLKPENIMLQTFKRGDEVVRIVDFGIAKVKNSVIAPSTVNQAPVGTILYMSPEQLRGEKVGHTSDIYSLGLIAYEMVTGRRPFSPNSGQQLLEMHRAGVRVHPAELRTDLPNEAQAIILRALSFEPEHRYQSASEFGESLARSLTNDKPIGAVAVNGQAERTSAVQKSIRAALVGAETHSPREATTISSAAVKPVRASTFAGGISARLSHRSGLVVAAIIGTLLLAGLAGIYVFRGRTSAGNSALANAPQRSFAYWLTVQKMRNGRKFQDPFQSSGQEIFENGYKFRLNVASPDAGYLYVFNDGPPDTDDTTLTMVYPTPAKPNALVSGQPVQTNWNTLRGQAGTEKFWIVWSISAVSEFELIKGAAADNEKGAVTDVKSIQTVRDFLARYSAIKLETSKDVVAQQTRVQGTGDVLVTLAQLEHR